MKSYRKELHFFSKDKREIINITKDIEAAAAESKMKDGIILVNTMSTTASVFIGDDDEGLYYDYEKLMECLASEHPEQPYRHKGSPQNADAHLKRLLVGREVILALTNGRLDLGKWEQIFYYEFDGKRDKRVLIKIVS